MRDAPASVAFAKDLVDILNKIVVSVAVLCGGSWALYKFVILESPSAQVALAEIQRICAERGSLDIRIDAHHDGSNLIGKVTIKNIGTKRVNLEMEPTGPVVISRLASSTHGLEQQATVSATFPYVHASQKDKLVSLDLFSVLPGRTVDLPFMTIVEANAVYLISFSGGSRKVVPDDRICPKVAESDENFVWAASVIYRTTVMVPPQVPSTPSPSILSP